MLLVAPTVVPGAPRVSADATALPVRTATIDLLGAAGSLPFVADLEAALAEMARVLTPSGVAVVYDFAPGRRITGSDALTTWYDEFLRRWPREPAPTAVTPATLGRGPLRVTAHEAFTVTLDLDRTGYLAAVMTESNVARAVQRGEDGASIERWCARGLDPIFPAPRPVEFDAWFAILRP
jgi:SAM-dependent methyltransferase